ncbi:substrate-binding and GGDEF domain-containing protein [Paenibacillus kobensis]|uniref:substrate-binding and GGDEF domain-containing protein n=1 Tax=Paenibacillus kobensis TaxID=59841 RepID=UPI000FD93178|nr:GGDEF domain-containing protein [Paenibacillus kobensis]
MRQRSRIQLVSPFLDGNYYGKIFLSLLHEAKRRDIDLYVIQSLVNFPNQTPFPHPVGLESTDGWLLLTNPNSPLPLTAELLRAIERSGKPVVTIGYRENALPSHAVVVDNRRAAREAVNHLIRNHGHRRVAYVGSKEHVDLLERFEGYMEALSDNGIDYDDSLVYFMKDAVQPAGLSAGESLLSDNVTFTAVFAATDLIAAGLMEALQEAGLRLPEDIAVIGFDDLPSSASLTPPLTTVRQSFAELALLSLDRLDRLIRGQIFPECIDYLPTKLVSRSSCGCPIDAEHVSTSAEMHRRLLADMDVVIQRQYRLVGSWNTVAREDSFDLEQMFGDYYPWGCVAMWDDQEGRSGRLVVKQAYSRNGTSVPKIGSVIPIEQFPPSSWYPGIAANEFPHVHAMRNDKKDWGFITVIRPVDPFIHIPAADWAQTGFAIAQAALERDDLIRQIRHMAYHDGLTGLANRQMFQTFAQQCIKQAETHGTKFGILLLDLDQFKLVNDTWGHQAGDELLQQVAALLNDEAQVAINDAKRHQQNMASRLGGDEFILLLADIDGETDIHQVIDRIKLRFEEPFTVLGQAVHTSCSVGYAVYPDDGDDIGVLTRCADMKMYSCKKRIER